MQDKKTAAICVSGLFRYKDNFKKSVELLKIHNPDYEFRIFAHMWRVNNIESLIVERHKTVSEICSFNHGVDQNILTAIDNLPEMETLQVETFESNIDFLREHKHKFKIEGNEISAQGAHPDHVNAMSMFYGIWRANELRRIYCERTNHVFDIQVRMRYDNYFEKPVVIDDMKPGVVNVHHGKRFQGGTPDRFAIGEQSLMDLYSQTFLLSGAPHHHETMLRLNLERFNVPWEQTYNVTMRQPYV